MLDIISVCNQPPRQANSALYPFGVGKWGPASVGKVKAGMVHSISGRTWGVQVKLWDPLIMRAIPEHLRGVITMRCYINPHLNPHLPLLLPLLLPLPSSLSRLSSSLTPSLFHSSSSSSCGLSRGGRCRSYELAPCLSILRSVIGGC